MITQAIRALPNQIPYMWHQVKPLIDKALIYSNGEMLVEDILECLLKNEQELVIGYNNDNEILMALVGEIVNYPRKKVYERHVQLVKCPISKYFLVQTMCLKDAAGYLSLYIISV